MTIVRHEVACGSCSHFSGGNHQYHLMNVHPLDGEIKSNDATDRMTQGAGDIEHEQTLPENLLAR